jgi:hypothetical protein
VHDRPSRALPLKLRHLQMIFHADMNRSKVFSAKAQVIAADNRVSNSVRT